MVVSPSSKINSENLLTLEKKNSYKAITLKTDSGIQLFGLERRKEGVNKTLLILHGNARNLTLQPWFGLLDSVSKLPVNILSIDYQGYGKSQGDAKFSTMTDDARLAINYLPKTDEIYIYGLSLGSVMALNVANDSRVKGVVIEGGITNEKEMIELFKSRKILGSLYTVKIDKEITFNNITAVRKLNIPIFVIHGENDDSIPSTMGKRIFQASRNGLSEFYLVKNGKHCNSFAVNETKYLSRLKKFIEKN